MEADIDFIIRSRPTILEILENRGYNVDSYKGVSPEEILKLANTSADLLKIIAPKRPDGNAPVERAVVLYWVEAAVRLKVESEVNKLWDEDNATHYDPAKDEIIIMLSEPRHDEFDYHASKQWNTRKARVCFFQLKNLVTNPANHFMVPPHRKLTAAEVTELIKILHLKSKSELPHIKYHVDMQARVLGLVPGDIVEIKRPSETSGEATAFRVCTV